MLKSGFNGIDAVPMSNVEVVFTDPIENAKRIVSLLLNEEESIQSSAYPILALAELVLL